MSYHGEYLDAYKRGRKDEEQRLLYDNDYDRCSQHYIDLAYFKGREDVRREERIMQERRGGGNDYEIREEVQR